MKLILQTMDDEDWYWKNLENMPDDLVVVFPTQKMAKHSDLKELYPKFVDNLDKISENDCKM